jgi:hypothetical protein
MAPDSVDIDYWAPLVREVKRYRGIVGLSTPSLAVLDANVIIGTKHEALTVAREQEIAGFYLAPQKKIFCLGDALVPWDPEDTSSNQSVAQTDGKAELVEGAVSPISVAGTEPVRMKSDIDLHEFVDAVYGIEAAMRERSAQEARRTDILERLVDQGLRLADRSLRVAENIFYNFERWLDRGKKK